VITTAAQRILKRDEAEPSSDFPAQFWDLMERYRGQLMSQAFSILNNQADAEDAVQETFCTAFRERHKLTEAESIQAWMLGINRLNALTLLRTRRRASERVERKFRMMPDRSITTGGYSGVDMQEALARIIATLPPHLRAVMALRHGEKLSYRQIAERLNIPLGTVGCLVCDASKQLYGKLKALAEKPQPTALRPIENGGSR
jgi:RNA polymerase sigma-70 factor (ECF subfamily)